MESAVAVTLLLTLRDLMVIRILILGLASQAIACRCSAAKKIVGNGTINGCWNVPRSCFALWNLFAPSSKSVTECRRLKRSQRRAPYVIVCNHPNLQLDGRFLRYPVYCPVRVGHPLLERSLFGLNYGLGRAVVDDEVAERLVGRIGDEPNRSGASLLPFAIARGDFAIQKSLTSCSRLLIKITSHGTLSSLLVAGDVTLLRFHREAASLQDAIQSAIADVNAAGYHVGHVELEPDSVATQTA